MQVDLPNNEPDVQGVPGGDEDSSSEDLAMLRQEEWARAEETYGLHRPDLDETVVVVHRQTTARFAIAPVTWDDSLVGHDWLPDEILHDIARWYNDIFDNWEDIVWWLCRVHDSSRASILPVLACTNYVLVRENDFLAADMRPHGLIELVFGGDQFLFPPFLPKWINLADSSDVSGTHITTCPLWYHDAWVLQWKHPQSSLSEVCQRFLHSGPLCCHSFPSQ